MNTISEAELIDYMVNKAVKKLHIIGNPKNKFRIVVILTWKEGEWHLITTRGKPREWASLDRLAKHIQEKYDGDLPPITLTLTPLT
jgi:hypothetical protein